jgi:coenzyme F420-reducing hydrogenase delta subunit/Pyruvate/2-oxoacid:ferredoxin oxidoreductase delta subunit
MADLANLEKWKGALNKCIRCGYCYEHCQIYKSTRWEIDSPRGKLVLLYGLLSGEVEPSDYVANKLFECFHCNRCQKACSSGVPVQDIYTDARAFFLEAGFDVVGTTSQTDHDICARCLNCVRMCKHEARSFVDGKVVTDRLKCQSCGSCLDICSEKGVTIGPGYGTNPDELLQSVKSFFRNPDARNAKAVVYSCGWSTWPGFQTARLDAGQETDPEYLTLVTACSGRLKSHTVLETLDQGAWGVLVCCCPDKDCEHGGSERTKARMQSLASTLSQIDIDPRRVQVAEVAPANPKQFIDAAKKFMDDIRSLGPLQGGGQAENDYETETVAKEEVKQ